MSTATNILHLLETQDACALATSTTSGELENSYCPYLYDNKRIYLFVSELSPHTSNLKHRPDCASLITQQEAPANPFARPRLSLRHAARFISREDESWTKLMARFEHKHGKTVALLRSLPDFHLLELEILKGTYIEGFGKAYVFEGDAFAAAEQKTGR